MAKRELKAIRRQFSYVYVAAFTVIVIGSVIIRHIEDLSWVDSFYFSVVALTTVGFGDVTPQSDTGKIFSMFYLIVGIGIIGAMVNLMIKNVAAHRVERENKKHHGEN